LVEWSGLATNNGNQNKQKNNLKKPLQNEVEKHGKTIQKVKKNRKSETYKQYKRYLIHTKIN